MGNKASANLAYPIAYPTYEVSHLVPCATDTVGMANNASANLAYEHYLRRAVSEDLTAVTRLGFLYRYLLPLQARLECMP